MATSSSTSQPGPGDKPPEYSSIAGGPVMVPPQPTTAYNPYNTPPGPGMGYQGGGAPGGAYQSIPQTGAYQGSPAPTGAYKGAPLPPASSYPAGYGTNPPAGYTGQVPSYQTVTIAQHSVVVVGGCPACRVGVLEDDFTCCGVCCAIFFFPLGILCCLAMRQRRCPNCGAVFG